MLLLRIFLSFVFSNRRDQLYRIKNCCKYSVSWHVVSFDADSKCHLQYANHDTGTVFVSGMAFIHLCKATGNSSAGIF